MTRLRPSGARYHMAWAIGLCWPLLLVAPSGHHACGQDVRGKTSLQHQLDDLELKGTWYYDDLVAARKEARRTGKPLFVVLRCPP